jgi:hypothetical protein
MIFNRLQFSFSSVQLLFVFLFLLSGCTTYGPSDRFLGLSRQEVITLLGPPRPLPDTLDGARRLDFPRGPMGKHTYSVYFDDDGRVSGFKQLLTEGNFRTIKDGMDISEVIERIGVATDTFLIARNRGYVWNYRYENTQCKWFQIEFTAESKVRSAGYGIPPECRRRFMSF